MTREGEVEHGGGRLRPAEALEILATIDEATLDGHHMSHVAESYVMAGSHARGVALLDRAVAMGFYAADYYERISPFLASVRRLRARGGACTRAGGGVRGNGGLISESAPAACQRPMLSSRMAALRCNPRGFARFIGDPLKATLNSSCVMASNSPASVCASLPAIASRERKGGVSRNRLANRTFHGHTSLDIWRYNRFEIALSTGCRTLRRTTT